MPTLMSKAHVDDLPIIADLAPGDPSCREDRKRLAV